MGLMTRIGLDRARYNLLVEARLSRFDPGYREWAARADAHFKKQEDPMPEKTTAQRLQEVADVFPEQPNWIAEAVKNVLQAQQDWEEDLIRKHFAATPIALATAERLKIMPWDIEVQKQNAPLPKASGADPAHAHMLILEEKVRIVEYTPRRWEMNSVRSQELEETSKRGSERIIAAIQRLRMAHPLIDPALFEAQEARVDAMRHALLTAPSPLKGMAIEIKP